MHLLVQGPSVCRESGVVSCEVRAASLRACRELDGGSTCNRWSLGEQNKNSSYQKCVHDEISSHRSLISSHYNYNCKNILFPPFLTGPTSRVGGGWCRRGWGGPCGVPSSAANLWCPRALEWERPVAKYLCRHVTVAERILIWHTRLDRDNFVVGAKAGR